MSERSVEIRSFKEEDNSQLLELAKKCPMEGDIEAYIDRSPRFMDFYYLTDKNPTLLVATEKDKILGCLGSSHFNAHVNSNNHNISVWGDFKVAPESRGSKAAIYLFNEIYNEDVKRDNEFSIVSILKGNKKSLSFTKGKGKVPKAQQIDDYVFYSVLPILKLKTNKKYKIEKLSDDRIEDVVDLYNTYYSGLNLTPRYTVESFKETIKRYKLTYDDFYIAVENDKVKAVVAAWDQYDIQRYIVNQYTGKIKLLVSLYGLLRPFMKMPKSPQKGKPLRFMFLSLFAHIPGETEAMKTLVRHIHNNIRGKEYSFYNICFRENDELCNILKGTVNSTVYTHNFAFCTNPEKNIEDFEITSKACHIEYATLV